jgi:hypothetical protein
MKQLRPFSFLFIVLLVGCVPISPQAAQPGNDQIANAMSGGLRAIAKDATISDWANEVRKGSNGWTCWIDDPTTPTNDPICGDQQWAEFIDAYITGREPKYTGLGISYMLQGGTTASNDDPSLTAPAAGHDWVHDGPHVMLVAPAGFDPALFSNDHTWGGPYVMFAGTPYQHLMVPARPEVRPSADDPMRNAMSAGPLAIAEHATIMGMDKDGTLTALRQGDNGWTCWPDDPATPTNDPICGDAQWAEFIDAFFTQREPKITAIGIGYMLQGGSTASLTDPTATEPPAGQEWLIDGPHLMVLVPWPLDPAAYASDPHAGGPYIMYGGTPYEHLMVPVTEMRH